MVSLNRLTLIMMKTKKTAQYLVLNLLLTANNFWKWELILKEKRLLILYKEFLTKKQAHSHQFLSRTFLKPTSQFFN